MSTAGVHYYSREIIKRNLVSKTQWGSKPGPLRASPVLYHSQYYNLLFLLLGKSWENICFYMAKMRRGKKTGRSNPHPPPLWYATLQLSRHFFCSSQAPSRHSSLHLAGRTLLASALFIPQTMAEVTEQVSIALVLLEGGRTIYSDSRPAA